MNTDLRVREMKPDEAWLIIDYFLTADKRHLDRLGVASDRLPSREKWNAILAEDLEQPLDKRKFFYVIWELDGIPGGHSHIGDIVYGKEAYMHLHLWNPEQRKSGNGTVLVRESIKIYFKKFNLEKLFCQPNALNSAPNKTLRKIGFQFLESLETTPSWINCHQRINKWVLTRERFDAVTSRTAE
jgi:RimJ/RimL family protein N-acetyltransferase